ncbi:MAG: hypothetical protein AAFP08_07770 [Bacteroidota bacterium]
MKKMDDLINDLKQDSELQKHLASLLVFTDPGCWSNMEAHIRGLGYQVAIDELQQMVHQIAERDSEKANQLIQDWHQHVKL